MLCQECGSEMRLVPPGVSKKTGKPYNAFYSCQECKAIFNPPKEEVAKVEKPKPNGVNSDMMRLAYRKDLMIACIEHGVTDSFVTLWDIVEGK